MGEIEIRRANREDLGPIVALVRSALADRIEIDESDALEWLFGKGLLVAAKGGVLLGAIGWQAENLLAVTDLFALSADAGAIEAGHALLNRVEVEAQSLMCEAHLVPIEDGTVGADQILAAVGYHRQPYGELHRIWREVLDEFTAGPRDVWVKRLRDRMVMAPL